MLHQEDNSLSKMICLLLSNLVDRKLASALRVLKVRGLTDDDEQSSRINVNQSNFMIVIFGKKQLILSHYISTLLLFLKFYKD